MNQRTDQPGRRVVERADQVGTALGPVDVFINTVKDRFDLLVEFRTVGDDQDASIFDVFANPLGQPDHRQAFAGPLCMPDNSALTSADELLRGPDSEVLIGSAQLLNSRVKHDVVVDDFQKP